MAMRHPAILAIILAAPFGLNACGSGDQDGVGGVSATEARALNEAAAALDARAGAAASHVGDFNPAATAAAHADRGRQAPAPAPASTDNPTP